MLTTDRELTERDILGLSSAEAVVGFLASLGYRTEDRTSQTPANLGISAETLVHQIRRLELLADHEGLLQVYLVELTSVTVAAIRGLARAFRTLNVQFPLLILTHDYERLDFVLVEKVLPGFGDDAGPMGQKQVAIRPRTLTVDRRDPGRVELRVLRRFTYTEADPIAQGEKLLSAYAVADWSEEFFNNRALFSDYFLLERLRDDPAWHEDPKPVYRAFRDLYTNARSRWAGKAEPEIRGGLLVPALKALGFEPRPGRAAGDSRMEPDFRLVDPASKGMLAVCLAYPWDRHLDGKDSKDIESPEENPGQAVVSLLEQGEAQWAVVTNGKHWRLYAAKAHSRATNYYEIDLEEVLAADNKDPQESFRYFWLLFRKPSFRPPDCFLDRLLRGSAEYAKRLGERLKERVFEEIFPHLAEGFIEDARAEKIFGAGNAETTEQFLNQVFQGTLTLLYRLLFLLYAEARDLLPVKEYRGYHQKSLTRLKQEVAKAAGDIGDEVPEHLAKTYKKDSTALYDRLLALFHLVDQGSKDDNLPAYNGGLFLSKPDPADTSDEAGVGRFLLSHKVPDFYLARGLDLLARDEDEKTFKHVFIDYKSLGVRQLGSIYEGLLEFKIRIASEKLGIVKVKGKDVYTPWRELSDPEKEKPDKPEAKESLVVRKGDVFLENDKRERKATGSYYTPDYIVKYIVEHAVGPVLKEKFEAVTPKIREVQKRYRQRLDSLKAMGKSLPEHELAKTYGREVVGELFDVKVLDPAMGSGHFLVEAVDFITDRMLDFLNGFPWNPVMAMLEETRRTILSSMEDLGITIDGERLTDVNLLNRYVLKRCIYGVDLNPMAVELAKVSLWLDCFTLGAPLSFLDHHLRCGNSLIGVSVKEVQEAVEPITKVSKKSKVAASATEWKTVELKGEQFTLFGSRFAGLLLATDLMRKVGALSDVTGAQVRESRAEYRRASDALGPFKRILDVYTSQWFGNSGEGKWRGKKGARADTAALDFLKAREAESFFNARDEKTLRQALKGISSEDRRVAEAALAASTEKRFFHWELEFPEVFYGPRKGAKQVIERLEGAGFDAVVGNPPYGLIGEKEVLVVRYSTTAKNGDVFVAFIEKALHLVRKSGTLGYIVPLAWQTGPNYSDLREKLLSKSTFLRVLNLPFDVFPEAYVDVGIISIRVEEPKPDWRVATFAFPKMDKITDLAALKYHQTPQSQWAGGPGTIVVDPTRLTLLKKLEGGASAVPLAALTESARGILAREQDIAEEPRGHNWKLFFTGEMGRYEIDAPSLFVRYGENLLERPASFDIFVGERLLVRRLVNRRNRLMAVVATETFVTKKDIYLFKPISGTSNVYLLLGLINSRLLSFAYIERNVAATKDDFRQTTLEGLRALPIPRVEHRAVEIRGGNNAEQLAGLYRATLETRTMEPGAFENHAPETFSQLLAAVGETGTTLRFPTDALHDFLAYLAEEMIKLNKSGQAEVKRFLGWLEEALQLRSDKDGDETLEGLTGKTVLKEYLGDYQKEEREQPFEVVLEVLRKNSGRVGLSLNDSRQAGRIRQEYEKSLAILLPIKRRLAATDWLIDQLVYRLYGLTEEEIRIVEGTG